MAKKWDDDYLHVLICHLMEFTQMHQHFQQAWIIYTLYSHLIRSSTMQIELFFSKKYIFIFISFYTAVYLCMSGYDDGILYTSHANLPIACTISSHFDIFYVIFLPVVFIEWCDKIIRFLLRNSFQMNSNDNKQRMHLITTDNKLCQWVRSFDSIFILDIRIVHSALTA